MKPFVGLFITSTPFHFIYVQINLSFRLYKKIRYFINTIFTFLSPNGVNEYLKKKIRIFCDEVVGFCLIL